MWEQNLSSTLCVWRSTRGLLPLKIPTEKTFSKTRQFDMKNSWGMHISPRVRERDARGGEVVHGVWKRKHYRRGRRRERGEEGTLNRSRPKTGHGDMLMSTTWREDESELCNTGFHVGNSDTKIWPDRSGDHLRCVFTTGPGRQLPWPEWLLGTWQEGVII